MSSNPELTISFYPAHGESFAVHTLGYADEAEAVAALEASLRAGTPFQVAVHERGANPGPATLIVNPTNLVAVSVRSLNTSDATGQYL